MQRTEKMPRSSFGERRNLAISTKERSLEHLCYFMPALRSGRILSLKFLVEYVQCDRGRSIISSAHVGIVSENPTNLEFKSFSGGASNYGLLSYIQPPTNRRDVRFPNAWSS